MTKAERKLGASRVHIQWDKPSVLMPYVRDRLYLLSRAAKKLRATEALRFSNSPKHLDNSVGDRRDTPFPSAGASLQPPPGSAPLTNNDFEFMPASGI